jgi:hypothetical protein
MKKIITAAVAVSALSVSPAMAQTVSTYTVTGSVASICSASLTGAIPFGSLINPSTGFLSATSATATADTGAFCNGAGTTVEIGHSDLTNTTSTGAAPTGFTKTVTFTPKVETSVGTLSGNKTAGTSLGAFNGITVTAENLSAGGNKPLAGDYSGSITITLSPGV